MFNVVPLSIVTIMALITGIAKRIIIIIISIQVTDIQSREACNLLQFLCFLLGLLQVLLPYKKIFQYNHDCNIVEH